MKVLLSKYKTNTLEITHALHIIGFGLLTISGMAEGIRYAGSDGSDRAEMAYNTSKAGIVFLDLNNLKKINDNYGHKVGDEYIISASKIIKNSFGRYGNSYRIGGDEFCHI